MATNQTAAVEDQNRYPVRPQTSEIRTLAARVEITPQFYPRAGLLAGAWIAGPETIKQVRSDLLYECACMSEISTIGASDYERVIRSLELKLELLEYGLALPRDEDAIARTKAQLEEMRSRLLEAAA